MRGRWAFGSQAPRPWLESGEGMKQGWLSPGGRPVILSPSCWEAVVSPSGAPPWQAPHGARPMVLCTQHHPGSTSGSSVKPPYLTPTASPRRHQGIRTPEADRGRPVCSVQRPDRRQGKCLPTSGAGEGHGGRRPALYPGTPEMYPQCLLWPVRRM